MEEWELEVVAPKLARIVLLPPSVRGGVFTEHSPFGDEPEERMPKKMRVWSVTLVALSIGPIAVPEARAEVQENASIPVEIVLEIPCANGGAGEIVTLTGDLHILTSFVINGNVVRGRFHYQPQGISGYGSITGDHYQATGVTQGQFKSSLQNGQAVISFENNFRIIGQGTGNNFLVHENLHLTINANGDLTTVVDHVSADCK